DLARMAAFRGSVPALFPPSLSRMIAAGERSSGRAGGRDGDGGADGGWRAGGAGPNGPSWASGSSTTRPGSAFNATTIPSPIAVASWGLSVAIACLPASWSAVGAIISVAYVLNDTRPIRGP